MTETTPLDAALSRMQAQPEAAALRLRFHAELISSELFVLLEAEAQGDRLSPRIFDLAEAQAGLSLIVNAGADHAELLPPEALDWLAATLAAPPPAEAEAVPEAFAPPTLAPAALALLIPALERRLSGVPGLRAAVLAAVRWQDGGWGHVLALAGVGAPARPALARAAAEALEMSGLEEGALDVTFPAPLAMARIAEVGRALAPAPFVAPEAGPSAGMNVGLDPARPPRLR